MPSKVEGEAERDYFEFLFLYERTSSPGQMERIFRPVIPFYGYYKNQERAYKSSFFIYPVYFSHGTNYWKKWSVFHIFTGDKFFHEDSGKDDDLLLSPFIYWGKGETDKERYTGFFPFYGRYKNKLSWDEIRIVMFPLYASWSYRDYKARSVLWPFVMWGKSSTRKDIRIWPFYSSKVHKGKYRRKSIAWPFVQWGTVDMNKREPRKYFLFWPFYGRKWSENGNLNVHAVIPLLGIPMFSWGRDKKTESFNLKLFWFLYQYGYSKDPYVKKHIIFPFWIHYRYGSKDSKYYRDSKIVLLFSKLETHSKILDSKYYTFFPFFWYAKRHFKQEDVKEKYIKIWPLFHYQRDSRGSVHFRTLDLWPFRSERVDRYWGPVWTLYEYSRMDNGDRYHSALLRLFSTYRSEKRRRVFFLGFDTMKSKNEFSVQFLGGLFGYYRKKIDPDEIALDGSDISSSGQKKNRRRVKLFWYTFGKRK